MLIKVLVSLAAAGLLAGCVATGSQPGAAKPAEAFESSADLVRKYAKAPNPWKRIPVAESALAKRSPALGTILDDIAAGIRRQPGNTLVAVAAKKDDDGGYLHAELLKRMKKIGGKTMVRVTAYKEDVNEIRVYREGTEYPAGKLHNES